MRICIDDSFIKKIGENMEKLLNLLWTALQSLAMKLISFKNIIFIAATYIGAKVLYKMVSMAPDKTDVVGLFQTWVAYELTLLVLFYATNQIQKLILARWSLNPWGPIGSHGTGETEHEEEGEHTP